MVELQFPANGMTVDTYTNIQKTFMEKIRTQGTTSALDWLMEEKKGQERSHPLPICFQWEQDGSVDYIVELSETEDFASVYSCTVQEPRCQIDNLKVGMTYYWRVNGCSPFSFRTINNGYRFVHIDGLLNVRDIGGIKIKQGLLYRGADVERDYHITPDGKKTFTEQLQIRTQLDLRKEKPPREGASTVGESVRYVRLPYRPYKECFEDEHRAGICRIMEFLADESNYPIYFHCQGGADRTGMIALFLRALVGETDEQILVDYELTSLSTYAAGLTEGVRALGFRNRNGDYFVEFLSLLDEYGPGQSLAEKVPSFLLSCGVTQQTIDKVCMIIKI